MNRWSKESAPTTVCGRHVAYDREMMISICKELLRGEDLDKICAKPPMPIAPVVMGWIEDHPEARAIHRSLENLKSDRVLARQCGINPERLWCSEWEEEVRANCQRGWPADWIERQYVPPDWSKVYPLVGDPPVWSTENMEAYNELLNDLTRMLEPRDPMELILTKQAVDASWEAARIAREKNALPERKHQHRQQVIAERQRRTGAAETVAAKPATALDHSCGLETCFKYYQSLDIALSRAIKRRDAALREIKRWRDGLGAKARRLSDKFIAEQALAESYCARIYLSYAERAGETAPRLGPVDDVGNIVPALPTSQETAVAPALPLSEAIAAEVPPAVPPSEATAVGIPPAVPASAELAKTPPPRTLTDDEQIDWVGWLTGAKRYEWILLAKGAHKDFKQSSTSKKWLVENLVMKRKVIRPDQVCAELAQYLPPIAQPAPTVAASAEAPK